MSNPTDFEVTTGATTITTGSGYITPMHVGSGVGTLSSMRASASPPPLSGLPHVSHTFSGAVVTLSNLITSKLATAVEEGASEMKNKLKDSSLMSNPFKGIFGGKGT